MGKRSLLRKYITIETVEEIRTWQNERNRLIHALLKQIAKDGQKYAKLLCSKTTTYQIEYSLKDSFANSKKITIKKAATTSTTINKLLAGKKYYVRLRTFKIVKEKSYYSAWSKVKVATVK